MYQQWNQTSTVISLTLCNVGRYFFMTRLLITTSTIVVPNQYLNQWDVANTIPHIPTHKDVLLVAIYRPNSLHRLIKRVIAAFQMTLFSIVFPNGWRKWAWNFWWTFKTFTIVPKIGMKMDWHQREVNLTPTYVKNIVTVDVYAKSWLIFVDNENLHCILVGSWSWLYQG